MYMQKTSAFEVANNTLVWGASKVGRDGWTTGQSQQATAAIPSS